MISKLTAQLKQRQADVRQLAEWLERYAAAERDVNHPLHNARRAAWAAERNLGETVRALGAVKGGE
jgi:hypothetical protein